MWHRSFGDRLIWLVGLTTFAVDAALLLGGDWSYVDPTQSDPSTRVSSPDLEKGEWIEEKSEAIKAARREERRQNRKSAAVFVRIISFRIIFCLA